MNYLSEKQQFLFLYDLLNAIPIYMRVTIILLCLFTFHLKAVDVSSQQTKISLDIENSSIEMVLQTIEEKSDYYFLYNNRLVNVDKIVDISVREQSIAFILDQLFQDDDVAYEVKGMQIILHPGNLNTSVKDGVSQVNPGVILLKGRITDSQGVPVIGANIVVKSTSQGTVTDLNGNFSLPVNENAILDVSYIGYLSQEIHVAGRSAMNIVMQEDTTALEEIVVVGYGTQLKTTLTGAISHINNQELTVTKNQNIQNMLTGKIPGLRVIQKTSEPGTFNNQFDIRGFGSPLVVVDGVPRGDYQRLDASEIESISVLKDASAAVYGVRAANGVILITTKQGGKGKPKVDLSMYYGFQIPGDILKTTGAIDRMTLFNEKSMRSTTDPRLTYSMEDIEKYRTGEKASSDWYDAVLKNSAAQQQYNASLSGGSDLVDYYLNFGHTNQEGFFKSNDWTYQKFNIRANVNARIQNLKISVNLNTIFDETGRSNTSSGEIFKTLWRASSNDPLYANDTNPYYYRPSGNINNPIALMDADVFGHRLGKKDFIQTNTKISYDFPFIKGLKLESLFSYDKKTENNESYRRQYNEYVYQESTEAYVGTAMNTPSMLNRNSYFHDALLWNISLLYKKKFLDAHDVDALLLFEESRNQTDNFNASREFTINDIPYLFAGNAENQIGSMDPNGLIEYARKGLVGKFNYGYSGKYLAEVNFRYDASSRFPKNSRWGFFYGGSAGWRISEESFIKNHMAFVDNAKLRVSYGKMGDDGALDYQFLSGFDYPASGGSMNNYPSGTVFNGEFINALGFRVVANPLITWYNNETINLGADIDLWKNKLGVTIDLFQRYTNGLLANRSISLPGSFGAKMPQENLNSDQTRGLELELRHNNRIGQFHYGISSNLSLTRTKAIYRERSPSSNAYDHWRNNNNNRYKDIWFGYGAVGRYNTYEEIVYSPVYAGNSILPGDYIYEDWNNDGIIDSMDMYPIATVTNANSPGTDKRNYPLMNFAFDLSGQYKGFDINLLFQGSAMSYVAYGEMLAAPLLWDGNALDFLMDRWRPADPLTDPYDPSGTWISGHYAYGATGVREDSRFGIQNGSYLRLKSMEVGYTLPSSLLERMKIGISQARFYLNTYNLFTLTGVRAVDPERPTEENGRVYPLSKTINLGFNLSF